MSSVRGAWVPNWRFDVICLERQLGEQVADRFSVELLDVAWPRTPVGEAVQIVVPTVGEQWFDPDQLGRAAADRHGIEGRRCPDCGVCRWMPLDFTLLPALRIPPSMDDVDVGASPEWFGDGRRAFRQVLVRRELAELIAEASPRDFTVAEVR